MRHVCMVVAAVAAALAAACKKDAAGPVGPLNGHWQGAGSGFTLDYTLKDDTGEVLDSNSGKEPLAFKQGAQQIIPGLDKALLGMKVADTKKVVGTEQARRRRNRHAGERHHDQHHPQRLGVRELHDGTVSKKLGDKAGEGGRGRGPFPLPPLYPGSLWPSLPRQPAVDLRRDHVFQIRPAQLRAERGHILRHEVREPG